MIGKEGEWLRGVCVCGGGGGGGGGGYSHTRTYRYVLLDRVWIFNVVSL